MASSVNQSSAISRFRRCCGARRGLGARTISGARLAALSNLPSKDLLSLDFHQEIGGREDADAPPLTKVEQV
jgi:hypothetical protein